MCDTKILRSHFDLMWQQLIHQAKSLPAPQGCHLKIAICGSGMPPYQDQNTVYLRAFFFFLWKLTGRLEAQPQQGIQA